MSKRHFVGAALAMAVAAPAISAAPEATIARTRQAFADPKSRHIITVAHRACWESAPENSLAAVNACVALGVDAVEMDVRTTRDGVPVIMHDETVDRTTNGHGRVADLTAAYISTLRLKAKGGGVSATLTKEHVPTLDEYLETAKDRIMIVFDVKDGSQRATFAHIEQASMADQAIFFYECVDRTLADAIAPFRDKVTAIPIMFGKDGPLSPEAERCASNPPGWAHVKWSDPAWLHQTAASQDQHPVRLWTATMFPQDNAGYDDKRALGDPKAVWGAQIAAGAGMIMTNQPSALIRYLKSLEKGA